MNDSEANLFRIQLATIREKSKELSELEIEETVKNLSLIKKNIGVCERLLGVEL